MFCDATVLFDWLTQHVDGTVAGRVTAALVLVLAVIGSWGTFGGDGDVAEGNLPDGM
jgi:hypothetical protein